MNIPSSFKVIMCSAELFVAVASATENYTYETPDEGRHQGSCRNGRDG